MRVRLLRKWRTWPIGQKMEVFDSVAKEMIQSGIAEKYDGEMNNREKMKTEFFKPIKTKANVKNKR